MWSYPLWCVDGREGLQVGHGKLYAFPLQLLVDVDHACQVWTTPERVSPSLGRKTYHQISKDRKWLQMAP